jgi:hypothetical protein
MTKRPIMARGSFSREKDPGGRERRPPGVQHCGRRPPYGQVVPPLLLAPVLSPVPQIRNVPLALLEYL